MALGLAIVVLCATPFACLAGQPASVSPGELDRSIEETLGRREFAWRMPRESIQAAEHKDKGPIAAAVDWLMEILGDGIKKIGNWIAAFIEWLEGLLPKPDKQTKTSNGNWITPVRMVLMILLILLVLKTLLT